MHAWQDGCDASRDKIAAFVLATFGWYAVLWLIVIYVQRSQAVVTQVQVGQPCETRKHMRWKACNLVASPAELLKSCMSLGASLMLPNQALSVLLMKLHYRECAGM